jgi:hypothetical protein
VLEKQGYIIRIFICDFVFLGLNGAFERVESNKDENWVRFAFLHILKSAISLFLVRFCGFGQI